MRPCYLCGRDVDPFRDPVRLIPLIGTCCAWLLKTKVTEVVR